MRRLLTLTTVSAVALAAALVPAQARPRPVPSLLGPLVGALGLHPAPVCGRAGPGAVSCQSTFFVTRAGTPFVSAAPAGYTPSDLRAAYGLGAAATSGGAGQTVAIVDAYDDPTAASDLAAYRSAFGLPACGAGCFTKVAQDGSANFPAVNIGWDTEISLDLDMVSAVCPKCHLLLVEASGADNGAIGAAENTAARLHATVISDSFGGPEPTDATAEDANYRHPGISIVAASGDGGYGVQYPASSPLVLAVGGTTLTRGGSGFVETAWAGAGSGCSAYEAKPSWQAGIAPSCPSNRAEVDVAAVGDPATGVAVYGPSSKQSCLLFLCSAHDTQGWLQVGGTSVGSPLIAAVIALAGNAATFTPAFSYRHAAALHQVTSGSNCGGGGGLLGLFRSSCPGNELDTAGPGWNGPTGLGTPRGLGAF